MDEQQLKAVANSLKNLRATAAQKATQPAAPTPAQKQQKQEAAKQKAAEQGTAQPEQPSQSKRKSLAQRIADLEAREEKLKQQNQGGHKAAKRGRYSSACGRDFQRGFLLKNSKLA